jgi:hypothetical protein
MPSSSAAAAVDVVVVDWSTGTCVGRYCIHFNDIASDNKISDEESVWESAIIII